VNAFFRVRCATQESEVEGIVIITLLSSALTPL